MRWLRTAAAGVRTPKWRRLGAALAVAALAIGSAALPSAAAEQATTIRKYPPYPDVWGRMLDVPDHAYTGIEFRHTANGDLLMVYATDRKARDGASNPSIYDWFSLSFFEGRLSRITVKEGERLFRTSARRSAEKIVFPDGTTVSREWRKTIDGICAGNWGGWIGVTDAGGRILVEKALIHLFDIPETRTHHGYCSRDDDDVLFPARFDALYVNFIALKDGTFLAFYGPSKWVVRFDRNLNSPFIDNRRLFLIDWKEIRRLHWKAFRGGPVRSYLRRANDLIRDYLMSLEGKKSK